MVKWGLHMFMLGVCSVEDWKEKRLSMWKIRLYAAAVLLYMGIEFWQTDDSRLLWALGRCAGGIPGMGLLLLGKATRQAVGYGDGLLVFLIGISLGFWESMSVFAAALAGTFLFAIFLLAGKAGKKDSQIAFVPFLFLGMACAGV